MATYKPLQSVVLTAATTSITFFGIDQSYTDLVIVGNAATSVAGAQNVLRFNGSTGNYGTTELYGTGSSVAGYRFSGQTYMWFSSGVGLGSTLGQSSFTVNINNYSNSTTNKTAIMRLSSNSGTYPGTVLSSGLWVNTSPITSVTLYADTGSTTWSAGSTFSLYGIKSGAPKAVGGDVVATDGTYWYHAFKSSGTFTPQYPISCDVLVVAGGGSGGASVGSWLTGGGGAGGLLAYTSQSLTTSSYTITIGSGGSISAGSNSQFGSLTAAVGGGAGSSGVGGNGGSGGGAGGVNQTPRAGGTATSGQGNAGGANSTTDYAAGGGGGANAAGGAGSGNAGGAGGAGSSAYSSWGSVTSTGQNVSGTYYYAGGGGGGDNSGSGSTSGGAGGSGGGGAGAGGLPSTGYTGTAGTANTGGGGGGNSDYSSTAPGIANGGSGIVIVRYAV